MVDLGISASFSADNSFALVFQLCTQNNQLCAESPVTLFGIRLFSAWVDNFVERVTFAYTFHLLCMFICYFASIRGNNHGRSQ